MSFHISTLIAFIPTAKLCLNWTGRLCAVGLGAAGGINLFCLVKVPFQKRLIAQSILYVGGLAGFKNM